VAVEVKIYECENCGERRDYNFTVCPICHYNHNTQQIMTEEELMEVDVDD
jgi:predicted ATP-dependent serine protease